MNSTLFFSPNRFCIFFSEKTLFSTGTGRSKIQVVADSRSSSLAARVVIAKCSKNSSSSDGVLKEALSAMVGDRVEELLKKEENRELLDNLEKASERVDLARKELANIVKQETEAERMKIQMKQLETRASEIAECQREILEAKAMVEEAERCYMLVDEDDGTEIELERSESIKAALISGLVGTIVGLPIAFTQVTKASELILPLAITFISCSLFGVTFRYAVRKDLDNFQLKTGTAAAFGFVSGLAKLGEGPPLEPDADSFISHVVDGAVQVSESLLIFVFAAVSLDFCFKLRLLNPFPIRRSRTDSK